MRTSVNMRDELLVRLNEIARGIGYKSWRCMLTGIAKGEVIVGKGREKAFRDLNMELAKAIRSKVIASDPFQRLIERKHFDTSEIEPKAPDWDTPVA